MDTGIFLLLLFSFLIVVSHGQDRAKNMHCDSFRSHYEVYCRGIWTPEKILRLAKHLEKIEQFCPNYKKVCLKKKHGLVGLNKKARKQLEYQLKYQLSYEDVLKRLSDIIPCTPDCKLPHCTDECKCEHDWPTFQKFCYPSTVKEFDATCSSWFDRCPIFEQKALSEGPREDREVVTHPPLDVARRAMYNLMG